MARPLDPDLNPWDQQPDETDAAYQAFLSYRDDTERKVAPSTMSPTEQSARKRWSATWVWVYRARAWDRQVAAEEIEGLARYRVAMHRNHRRIASAAQAQFVRWLQGLTAEDVRRWTPREAVRVWEVATKIEREAAGMGFAEDGGLPEQGGAVEREATLGGPASLSELFGADPEMEWALSQAVYDTLYKEKG